MPSDGANKPSDGLARHADTPETHRYTIEPPADWVTPLEVPQSPAAEATATASSGTDVEYLLTDRQVRADQASAQYTRIVMRLANSAGVESESQLTLDFDPERDHLIVHSVTLRRGSQVLDELELGRIEVLQRESSLEEGLLDGALTFHLVMSDVRVGDVLDYSFTLERRDPEWGNRYFAQFPTRWDTPVGRSHLRILTRAGTSLYVLDHSDQKPTKARVGEWDSREWNWTSVPAFPSERSAPIWYEHSAAIQLSQFATWGEVVRTALPLFSIAQPVSPELGELIERMKSAADSDMGRALAVLRFTQEEVRYTGVELGEHAYRPTSPEEVLRRRYGDCKDKTLLAVALLRGLGIDAAPALVSTRWQAHAQERWPSPVVFNHAIVRARIRGTTYWLDPTAVAEGGDLSRYKQGAYGAALVLAPGVKDFEAIPPEIATDPRVSATAVYDFRAGWQSEAKLSVSTVFRGAAADTLRARLRSTTPEELGKAYLNYFKRRYPDIRSAEALRTHDDVAANELKVEEAYLIPKAFQPTHDGRSGFDVEAELVNEHLKVPDTPVRTTPLALDRFVNVSERIELLLPKRVPTEEGAKVIVGPGFEYRSRVGREGNNLILEYHYQTFADQVTVDQLDEFLRKREEARLNTFFGLSLFTPEAPLSAGADGKAASALQNAYKLVQSGDQEKARSIVDALIASKDFSTLKPELQHGALLLAGAAAYDARDSGRALTLLKRASESEGAGPEDWKLRLDAARLAEDRGEAATSLTTLAQRWPEALSDVPIQIASGTLWQTPKAGPGRYKLLKALYDAKYTSDGFPLSSWWRDLALLQLERGERNEAIQTLSHIADPYVAISILADKRFEPVRTDVKSQLDVTEVARQEVDLGRAIVKRNPDKLQPIIELSYFLLHAERYEEALALCDQVIAKVNEASGPKIFSDYADQYVWILDNRSEALNGLGRRDEALAQLLAASHLPELGDDNVSQVINLAGLYNDLSRPKEAREVLAALDPKKTSGYGRTQVANELLRSAVQLGEAEEVERQLQYLREHREDSVRTLQQALLRAGREDEAAQLLISRLEDLNERVPALMEVQEYQTEPLPPGEQQFWQRWQAMVGRADVQAAIAKVGTIGRYAVRRQAG